MGAGRPPLFSHARRFRRRGRTALARGRWNCLFAAVPVDMGTLPGRAKKGSFFSILESIARFHNETILSRRKRLLSLQNSASDGLFLQDMAEHYALARSNSALSTRADSCANCFGG